MAGATFSDWDPALKEIYSEAHTMSLAFVRNVLLGTLPKERSGGDYFVQNIHTNAPGGSSATWAKAKVNGTASKMSKLNITRVSMFQRVGIDLHLLLSAKRTEESIVKVTNEFDNGFKELAAKIERRLFRSSSGAIGKVASSTTVTSAVIYLTDKADAFNFQPGDKLNFCATESGSTVRSGGSLSGIATVSSVDTDAGTVTTAGTNLSSETGMAVADFIYQDGDYDACLAGLESWLPGDPSTRATKLATSFFGLTRSSNPQNLGGVFVNGATLGGDINDVFIKLQAEMSKFGGVPDLVIMPVDAFADLQRIWKTTGQPYVNVQVSGTDRASNGSPIVISKIAPGIKAQIGSFMVTIVPSRYCPSNRMYMLETGTWTLRYVGSKLPCFMLEEVEGEMLRLDTTGSTVPEAECYLAGYCNLGCEAPGRNGVAYLPTA